MEVQAFLNYWLILPQIWLIIGLVLITIEMLDGSQIFFLPLGLGSITNAALLYADKQQVIPYGIVPDIWYGLVIILAGTSIVYSLLLSIRRRKKDQVADVNDY